MKKILWILFIITGFYMGLQSDILVRATPQKYRVAQLEFAGRERGQLILQTWNHIPFAGQTLLQVAVHNTWLNYLLLILFTSLLMLYSYLQMQREKLLQLNELLRFNLVLTVCIFLLGIEENYLLLHNMRHVDDPLFYLNATWVALPMYLIAGWAILVLVVSLVRSGFTRHPETGKVGTK